MSNSEAPSIVVDENVGAVFQIDRRRRPDHGGGSERSNCGHRRLGRVPLAVSMAGMYSRNAAGTVDELSTDFFAQLDALDDLSAIPTGFNRTAFAWILGQPHGSRTATNMRKPVRHFDENASFLLWCSAR
jgi:hypothetical protein